MADHRDGDGTEGAPAPGASALGGGMDVFGAVDGIRLHRVAAGDARAPLVVPLHGFPDS